MKKRTKILLIVIFVFIVFVAVFVYVQSAKSEPEKLLYSYLKNVEKLKSREAYDLIYFEEDKPAPYEMFDQEIHDYPLTYYKLKKMESDNKGGYVAKVEVKTGKDPKRETRFRIQQIDGAWRIVNSAFNYLKVE